MTARTQVAIRINQEALDRIDAIAEKQDRLRSDVIRRCLARGLAAEEADQAVVDKPRRHRSPSSS